MENEEKNNHNQSFSEERIQSFLKGKMSLEDARTFRQEMKENEELRMKAFSMALLIKGMQETGRERDQVIINEVRNVKVASPISEVRFYIMRGLAVAACLCIMFTAYDYHDAKVHTEGLALSYVEKFNPPLPGIDDISRGRGDTFNVEAEKQVLIELNAIFESIRKNQDILSCINQLKPKFELAASEKLNYYTPYLKHIGYYLAIAQLQDNDRKAAIGTLKDLLELEPDFREANELLGRIMTIKCYWE